MSTTRRAFLGGAAASAVLPAVARGAAPAPAGSLEAVNRVVPRARAIAVAHGRVVVAHDRRRTIAIGSTRHAGTRLVDVGGQPVEVAISPSGRLAAVTTAFWDRPGLAIVDLRRGVVRDHVDVGAAPFGVAFTRDGERLIVTGGEQDGAVHVLDTEHFRTVARAGIGRVPRGVAVARHGRAWIALNGAARVVGIDIATARVMRSLRTPPLPDRVAVSPDGKRLLVSHGGLDAEHVSVIDIATRRVHRHTAGPLPSGVGWTSDGRPVVALQGAGKIVTVGAHRRRRAAGPAPRGLTVSGRRAWTASALTGAVREVRL